MKTILKMLRSSANCIVVSLFAYLTLCVIADSTEGVEEFKLEFPGPRPQEEELAESVCYELSGIPDTRTLGTCREKILESRASFAGAPPELQIKCQSEETVSFETKLTKNWQLVMLVNEQNYEEIINFILIEGSDSDGETISTLYTRHLDKNHTLWSVILDEEGNHSVWRRGPVVQPWKEVTLHLEEKNYEIKPVFLLDRYETGYFVEANFTWNSSDVSDSCFRVQNTCNKKTQGDFFDKQIKAGQERLVHIEGLPLDDNCTFLVTGKHGSSALRYSTPACHRLPACKPLPELAKDVKIKAIQDEGDCWIVNVEWAKPTYDHDFYNVTLRANKVHNALVLGNSTKVTFRNVTGDGFYNVSVTSIIGNSKAYTNNRALFPDRLETPDGMVIDAVWFSALLAAGGAALLYALALSWRRRQNDKMRESLYYTGLHDKSIKFSESENGSELAEDKWEVRPESLILHEVIGEGAFGVVRRGTLSPGAREVAVKMLKDFPCAEEVRAFRAEVEVMKSVGAHPHVVSLLACVSARRPLLVAEYCARGDLLSYLRSAWNMMSSKQKAKSNINKANIDYRNDLFKNQETKIPTDMVVNQLYDMQGTCDTELTSLDLLSFCRQIAMGMEFLASNRVVHRDLAARNVLVTADRTLKIADFGLSRDVYQENQYKQKGNGKMPVKWMALESLTHRIYTTQSDVWSFGVVMWEVWSLGAAPYEAVSGARLLRLLRAGYRMPRPTNADHHVYELMLACWHEQPRSRPTFSDLHAKLDSLLAETSPPYLPLHLQHSEDPLPPTASPILNPHRYMKRLLRGEVLWSGGRSYERPALFHKRSGRSRNHNLYTTRPLPLSPHSPHTLPTAMTHTYFDDPDTRTDWSL